MVGYGIIRATQYEYEYMYEYMQWQRFYDCLILIYFNFG